MKPRLYLALAVLALAGGAFAQPKADPATQATRILEKVRKLDLLNQIVPVLLKPDQLQKLLTPIEKARQADKQLQAKELEEMKAMEARVDKAIDEANKKDLVPSRELLADLIKLFKKFELRRAAMVQEQTDKVFASVKEVLDEGQRKAATNSLDPSIGAQGKDLSKLTDDDKLRAWVRVVLMDPMTYDILKGLLKEKS
ncbi:MAG: hypothetical protein KF733_03655 [Fimbriimonadaceae bacterium]|nr:MAG: hypothetical protein KF733_03655 [Fimbriimonadaceae bacterium]